MMLMVCWSLKGGMGTTVIGSTGFSPAAVRVQRNFRGDRVTVEVFYTDPTDVPMIGNLFPDIVVSGSATMRRET